MCFVLIMRFKPSCSDSTALSDQAGPGCWCENTGTLVAPACVVPGPGLTGLGTGLAAAFPPLLCSRSLAPHRTFAASKASASTSSAPFNVEACACPPIQSSSTQPTTVDDERLSFLFFRFSDSFLLIDDNRPISLDPSRPLPPLLTSSDMSDSEIVSSFVEGAPPGEVGTTTQKGHYHTTY